MYRFALLCLFFPQFILSQDKLPEKITDTMMVVGVINNSVFAGKSKGDFCIIGTDKFITQGTPVLIGGVETCKSISQFEPPKNFYTIFYKGEKYFIEFDKVSIRPGMEELLFKMDGPTATAFKDNAEKLSKSLEKLYSRQAISFLDGCKSKGLAILTWSFFDESEYTEGKSVNVSVYNPTSKVIKYIYFTFAGYNAVGDKVIDRKRGGNIIMTAIGPINPQENGSYNYKYVWFTSIIQTAKITSIKVQFMDGSIKMIPNPKEIMLPKMLYQSVFGD